MGGPDQPAECVVNISEGRDRRIIDAVRVAGGDAVLDVHSDADHHRSVLTLGGPLPVVEKATQAVVAAAVEHIDLREHDGVHPRLGAADVVPFVPLTAPGGVATGWDGVLGARARFARWAGDELALPCFLYGPERSLPEVRRTAFTTLAPDTGPARPHPTAGAAAVGARAVLVAYNLWLGEAEPYGDSRALVAARSIAAEIRGPAVRALGLAAGGAAQVSLNLLDPAIVTVADAFDTVAAGAASRGCSVVRAELVGLVPAALLEMVPRHRWAELDLSVESTIECRLASPGLRPRSIAPGG